MITVILIVWSSSLQISFQNEVGTMNFDANVFFDCGKYISQTNLINDLSCVLVLLLMVALLRYISDLIPFLNTFVRIISEVRSLPIFKILVIE